MKYIAYAFAVMAGLSAGCTARGYRPPQNFAGYKAIESAEYNAPIDFFVERELAIVNDDKKFVVKNSEQELLVKLISSEHSQEVILSRNPLVTAVSYHNVLLRELFAGKKIQRWLLDGVYNNAKPAFVNIHYESLSDEEQNNVDASLDKLCMCLNDFDYKNIGTKKEIKPYSNIVLENIASLSYLQDVLNAKADVEILEGHFVEADNAYNHAAMIKKSLARFDDFKNRKDVWNAVKTQNARELFGMNHQLSTAGIIDSTKNIETLYAELLQKTEEIFRYASCKDKHESFQFVLSYALEIPSRLYESGKIREDSAIVLRKKIITDAASVLKKLGQTDKTDYWPDLSQIVFSIIPGIGMLHVNEWKDCISKDWFVPEGVTDEKIYAAVIREGRRLMSGDGNSAHYVGSTNPAIISRGTAVISTTVSVVVPQLLKSHSSRAPETISQPDNPIVPPPIGGGGTTGPGVGN